eukprot:CAMPEP_0172864072 /NCGR_PEP_ID=MMETSP1075-20121228/79221_1 /TAXON_ID=2916 /ORGANISM="Ceratium fusus, Strain PA161109" /LENGTH=50 /DNA_ID=CAMNT_0013712855 /DNA_START=21 /DNA_END=170 /DNA_ORIENTATION=-
MPTPVILRHVGKGSINATLCRYGVRASGEDFADACCLESMSNQSSSSAEA